MSQPERPAALEAENRLLRRLLGKAHRLIGRQAHWGGLSAPNSVLVPYKPAMAWWYAVNRVLATSEAPHA